MFTTLSFKSLRRRIWSPITFVTKCTKKIFSSRKTKSSGQLDAKLGRCTEQPREVLAVATVPELQVPVSGHPSSSASDEFWLSAPDSSFSTLLHVIEAEAVDRQDTRRPAASPPPPDKIRKKEVVVALPPACLALEDGMIRKQEEVRGDLNAPAAPLFAGFVPVESLIGTQEINEDSAMSALEHLVHEDGLSGVQDVPNEDTEGHLIGGQEGVGEYLLGSVTPPFTYFAIEAGAPCAPEETNEDPQSVVTPVLAPVDDDLSGEREDVEEDLLGSASPPFAPEDSLSCEQRDVNKDTQSSTAPVLAAEDASIGQEGVDDELQASAAPLLLPPASENALPCAQEEDNEDLRGFAAPALAPGDQWISEPENVEAGLLIPAMPTLAHLAPEDGPLGEQGGCAGPQHSLLHGLGFAAPPFCSRPIQSLAERTEIPPRDQQSAHPFQLEQKHSGASVEKLGTMPLDGVDGSSEVDGHDEPLKHSSVAHSPVEPTEHVECAEADDVATNMTSALEEVLLKESQVPTSSPLEQTLSAESTGMDEQGSVDGPCAGCTESLPSSSPHNLVPPFASHASESTSDAAAPSTDQITPLRQDLASVRARGVPDVRSKEDTAIMAELQALVRAREQRRAEIEKLEAAVVVTQKRAQTEPLSLDRETVLRDIRMWRKRREEICQKSRSNSQFTTRSETLYRKEIMVELLSAVRVRSQHTATDDDGVLRDRNGLYSGALVAK